MSCLRLATIFSFLMVMVSTSVAWAQGPEAGREERRDFRRRDRDGNRDRPERNDREGRPEFPPLGGTGGPPPSMMAPPPGAPPQAPSTNTEPTSPTKDAPTDKTKGKKVRAPRPSVTKKLPERYSARDTNRDGQIGMYEWSRSDLTTFFSLDRNGDGFLEPSEFPDSTPTVAGTANPTPMTGPGGSPIVAGPPGAPSAAETPPVATVAKPAVVAVPVTDPATRAAQLAYEFLDQDKDGAITPAELQRSRTVRPLFEKAQIDLQQTFTKEKFIETRIKVSQASK